MNDDITVVIPTSPIPSCPSTHIITATIESIRLQLPNAPIIVTCDGPESGAVYTEYIERIRTRNTEMVLHDPRIHHHQSGMIGPALELVKTPLIYYLESDWLTLPDIPWPELSVLIRSGRYNYIKLHAAPRISPAHEHLMRERFIYHGLVEHDRFSDAAAERAIPIIRTVQWSQNPHLASTEFYRSLNEKYLVGKCDFIENIVHGIVGQAPWEEFKLGIFNPLGGDMMRCYHLDGKGSR